MSNRTNRSYARMIEDLISRSANERLTVSEIIDGVADMVGDKNLNSLKNTIRHTLTTCGMFERVRKGRLVKPGWWVINKSYVPTKRRKSQRTSKERSANAGRANSLELRPFCEQIDRKSLLSAPGCLATCGQFYQPLHHRDCQCPVPISPAIAVDQCTVAVSPQTPSSGFNTRSATETSESNGWSFNCMSFADSCPTFNHQQQQEQIQRFHCYYNGDPFNAMQPR